MKRVIIELEFENDDFTKEDVISYVSELLEIKSLAFDSIYFNLEDA